jgi:hypothetical protein
MSLRADLRAVPMHIRIIVATCAVLLSSLFTMESSQSAWAGPPPAADDGSRNDQTIRPTA